jgi:transglutaminase-like putative cysteine protease
MPNQTPLSTDADAVNATTVVSNPFNPAGPDTLTDLTGSSGSTGSTNTYGSNPDEHQTIAFALAAVAGAVFVGSQLLAHESVKALGIGDHLVAITGSMLMAWLYREQLRGQPMIRSLFVKPHAQRLLATPEVLILPLSLALLSIVPTIERQGHGLIGLALRLAIGLVVVASVNGYVASWLAMASLVTMVFHPWDHPIVVTAIFSGLALVVLGLANLNRRSTAFTGNVGAHTLSSGASTVALKSRSLQRRRKQHIAAITVIAAALGGAALLEPTARKLAWRSGESEFGQRDSSTSLASKGGTFTALSRSSSLELAYRPTRSNDVVLRVFTYARAPIFLRTQTFDTWTGRTWTESSPPQREDSIRIGLWDARPFGAERVQQQFELNAYNPEAAAHGLARTVVQAQTKLNGVVPVPTEALGAIWLLDGADQTNEFLSSTMFWRTDGTASSVREKGASPIYTVLHDTRAGGPIAQAAAIRKTHPEWLSLDKVSPAVRQLATEIVGKASTSAEKVERIRAWMTKNVAYNLTAKDPGRGADPVNYLLFTSKEGSCTHFATATAALLRSVGVPTRISTGFVAQEQPRISQYIVRGRDAHAWAEVPLERGDWLQVDTTIMAKEVFPPEPSERTPYVVLGFGIATTVLILLGVKYARSMQRKRVGPKSTVFVAQLMQLARRLHLQVPAELSTVRLAQALDGKLAAGVGSSTRGVWLPGALGEFGQRLEAASFGAERIDLSDGPELLRAASRRARSQRWEQRRLWFAQHIMRK